MNPLKKILIALHIIKPDLSPENIADMKQCKKLLIELIKEITLKLAIIQGDLPKEIQIPIIYLKIFAASLEKKKFRSLDEAMQFMNDIRGIVEKAFYVKNYLARIADSAIAAQKAAAAKAQTPTVSEPTKQASSTPPLNK